jgi:hypothetical protein
LGLCNEAEAEIYKGWTLVRQGKFVEAIAVYDEIDRRFGQDDTPGIRKWVAEALVYKGVTLKGERD